MIIGKGAENAAPLTIADSLGAVSKKCIFRCRPVLKDGTSVGKPILHPRLVRGKLSGQLFGTPCISASSKKYSRQHFAAILMAEFWNTLPNCHR